MPVEAKSFEDLLTDVAKETMGVTDPSERLKKLEQAKTIKKNTYEVPVGSPHKRWGNRERFVDLVVGVSSSIALESAAVAFYLTLNIEEIREEFRPFWFDIDDSSHSEIPEAVAKMPRTTVVPETPLQPDSLQPAA